MARLLTAPCHIKASGLATPVNWQPGGECVILPSVSALGILTLWCLTFGTLSDQLGAIMTLGHQHGH